MASSNDFLKEKERNSSFFWEGEEEANPTFCVFTICTCEGYVYLKETDGANEDLVRCVFNFLYGCCVFPNDERRVLEVLSHLVHMQVASDVDPRRVLRKGSAAFCRLYRLFSDGLFAAKVSSFVIILLRELLLY